MGTTERTFGLIGSPLTHSFSENYFREKFEHEGVKNCVYHNFQLSRLEDLHGLINEISGLEGLNVTIPFKEEVLRFCDELDEEARRVGAVNCLSIKNGRLKGYNTDVYGFAMSIKPFLENKYERALILGTGGASKAVAYVLGQWRIAYQFLSRQPAGDRETSYDGIDAFALRHFPLIVNTTPLGMFPETEAYPSIPYEGLTESHFLVDLIYNPSETAFLRKGREAGAKTMNGLSMLRLQAERSWQIWNARVNQQDH